MANEARAELTGKLEELANSIITDPERLAEFVRRWHGGFRNYSLYNWLLIAEQCPTATLLAGFKQWNSRGRKVLKGSKAIKILAPVFQKEKVELENGKTEEHDVLKYFTIAHIFDVSQTEGEPVKIGAAGLTKGAPATTLERIIKAYKDWNWKFTGPSATAGSCNHNTHTITLAQAAENDQIACALHELAHGLLHGRDYKIDRPLAELEAEATSFIVCSYFGLENTGAKYYIGHWNQHGDYDLKEEKTGLRILGAAQRIINAVEKVQVEEPAPALVGARS